MAKLAREAGFTDVEIIPTSGKPGVFGVINAGAPTTVGIYFMYDVKQFDPAEWSSPPLEGKIVDKAGNGQGLRRSRSGEPERSGDCVPQRIARFQRSESKAAGKPRAGLRRRRRDRLAALSRDCEEPQGHGRAAEIHGRIHAFGRTGSRRQRRDRSRRQRRRRAGAGFHRREMGTRSQARRSLQPGSHRGQPHVAPGAGAEHADPARRSHSCGDRLLRQGKAADSRAGRDGRKRLPRGAAKPP